MAFQTLISFQPAVQPPPHVIVTPICAPPPSGQYEVLGALGWLPTWQPPLFPKVNIRVPQAAAPAWAVPIFLPYTELPEGFLPLTYRRFNYGLAQAITGLTIGPLTTAAAPAPTTVACAMTVAELRLQVEQRVDDPAIYYSPDEILHAINISQRVWCLLTRCLEKQASFTLTNAVAFYDDIRLQIPDFLLPLRVYHSGTRLIADTLHNLNLRDSTWRARAGNPTRYAMAGWKLLAITPQPASGVHTLDFWYAAEPATLVGESDTPQIPPEQQIFLPDCAAWILRLKEGSVELQSAKKFLDRFLEAAAKHGQFVGARSQGQLYDSPPFDLASWDRSRFLIKLKQQVNPVAPPQPKANQ